MPLPVTILTTFACPSVDAVDEVDEEIFGIQGDYLLNVVIQRIGDTFTFSGGGYLVHSQTGSGMINYLGLTEAKEASTIAFRIYNWTVSYACNQGTPAPTTSARPRPAPTAINGMY